MVIPFAERLPLEFMERLTEFAQDGLRVIFLRSLPSDSSRPCTHFEDVLATLRSSPRIAVLDHDNLVDKLLDQDICDVRVSGAAPTLRAFYYTRGGDDLYFFVNESTHDTVDVRVAFHHDAPPVGYDPLANALYACCARRTGAVVEADLFLEPYESTFIVFGDETRRSFGQALNERPVRKDMLSGPGVTGPWKVSMATAEDFPSFRKEPSIGGLGNISIPDVLPRFSGTVRYETEIEWMPPKETRRVFLDLGAVYETAAVQINGIDVGVRIAPPYRVEATRALRPGMNHLRVDVTNTLAKHVHDNFIDRAAVQEPSGLIGPVQLLLWHNPILGAICPR